VAERIYVQGVPPQTDSEAELRRWLLQELQRVGTIMQELAVQQVTEHNAAPKKLRTGMVVLADGTNWNPGSGRGYYGYDAATAAWRFLG